MYKCVTERYFTVMLFLLLYKMVLTFESVDEILECDHSNKSYRVVLSTLRNVQEHRLNISFVDHIVDS